MERWDEGQARKPLGNVEEQLFLLQHTEELLAQADALSQQYEEWTYRRNFALTSIRNGRASWQHSLLTEQIWAASQPMNLRFEHLSWEKHAHDKNQSALQQHRLFRCRLAREWEQLDRDSEQLLREERFQQRAELSFLERVHAQNHTRQADFMKKGHELLGQLRRQREQQLPSTTCAEVQTDVMCPVTAAPQTARPQENSNESYSESAFESESEASDYGDDFDDDSQSSNSSLGESGRRSHSSSSLSGGASPETSEWTRSSSANGGAGGEEVGGINPSTDSVTSMISNSQMASATANSISIGESIKSIGSASSRSSRKSNSNNSEIINANSVS